MSHNHPVLYIFLVLKRKIFVSIFRFECTVFQFGLINLTKRSLNLRFIYHYKPPNLSSTKEIPSVSFYSSRKRINHEVIVTNGRMAKKSKPTPEVICLSDDDDDHHHDTHSTSSATTVIPIKSQPSINANGDKKRDSSQASDWLVQRKDIVRIPELTIKHADLIKKALELPCSAVRFGTVEFSVEAETILLKETEFELKLKSPLVTNLSIKLAYTDILSFYFSFQSTPPSAFIQVRPDFAELFVKYIRSTDEHGKLFDPKSTDERRRRIVLCLKSLTAELERIMISSVYHYLKAKSSTMNICCLSGSRAQELYNLSRFAKLSALVSIATPFAVEANDLAPKIVGLNNNTIRFDLSRDDLICLNEGEFLNDNIIDFYLQYVYYDKLSEEDRKRSYLFNSFFYTRLTRKGNGDIPSISAAERRYSRVKRWLRDVDIFSKDFLIVPINQTAHWYIVIIQYHNNVLTERDLISDDDDDDKHAERSKTKKKKTTERLPESTTTNSITTTTSEKSSSSTSLIHPIEVLDEADEVTGESDHPPSNVPPKDRSQTPAIIMFDSLRAGSKNRVAATLREFLQMEYDHKKTLPVGSLARKIFNLDTLPTIEAAVPQQPNYFDCGLYILQYMESFFAHRSPTTNYQLPSTFASWCEKNSMGSSKRKQIFDIINEHTIIPKEE